MIDQAGIMMAQGLGTASERIQVSMTYVPVYYMSYLKSIIWRRGNVFTW